MILNKDFFDNITPPNFVLGKADGTKIGEIICLEQKVALELNAPNEISFKTPLYVNNTPNPIYAEITEGKFIYVENIGAFVIQSIDAESDGNYSETKTVTCKSMEALLGQKYLELFTINMGTVESIDGVSFYQADDSNISLLNLILEKCPDWKIGHVSASLATMQRSFEVTRQDIYTFLTSEVSEAFGCVFVFDTLNMTISAYKEDEVGEDTDIYISYDNLLKDTNISCSIDDIKTCLTVLGEDDLNLREVNMGYDKIYNLDFFHSREYMSDGLYDAYAQWKEKWLENVDAYTELLSEYQKYYDELNYELNLKMPSDLSSTNWEEYGLVPLQEQKAAYEQQLSVMMKNGQGNPEHADYLTVYLPVYNCLQDILSQIEMEKNMISTVELQQESIKQQMDSVIACVDMTNNFTSEQLKELTKFIREDELSSSNYAVTDSMSGSEQIEVLNSLLEYGNQELLKVSQPQVQFSANLVNLFAIKEFDRISDKFDIGNYIHIILRDDYIVKARILKIELDFLDGSEITVTFGNVNKLKDKNVFTDVSKVLKTASNISTNVSFRSSYWNKANKEANSLSALIDNGLLGQGKYLSSGEDSQFTIDKRGIFLNTTSGDYAGKDSIFLGGGKILFTSDNWKTVSMSVGRVDLTVGGEKKSVFGNICDVMLGGYIVGSVIDGNTIYVGGNQSDGKIVMYDKNGKEAGRWDVNGLVLPPDTTITWANVTDTENIATKSETVPINEVSQNLSSESGAVTIGQNRMSILSDNFKLQGSGEVSANGTFQSSRSDSNQNVHTISLSDSNLEASINNSLVGRIGAVCDASGNKILLCSSDTDTKAFALSVQPENPSQDCAFYYYLNNGLNPYERTERHILTGDVFVSGKVCVDGSLRVNGDIVSMNGLKTDGAYISDMGSSCISSDGQCDIYFDSVSDPASAETVSLNTAYQVFLTSTNDKKTSFVEKKEGHFIVHGETSAAFDWIIVCRQRSNEA